MLRAGPKQAAGTTLIEVLVSLLILSVGLLGMVGLQTVSLRNNQSAYLRTQATIFSMDMSERIRANPQGVEDSNYNGVAGQLTASCTTSAGCSAAQLAAHDIAEWNDALQVGLPLGSGTVCVDSTPADGTPAAPACDGSGALYTIKIWWDDNRDGSASQRYVVSLQP